MTIENNVAALEWTMQELLIQIVLIYIQEQNIK